MKNPTKLKELILESVDMVKVLLDYRVEFIYSPEFTDEVQFRCPFHGKDTKPSARYYRSTQSAYCWVCQKKWDVIGFIMEKEQFNFIGAIKYIINKYKVDTSSISDDPELKLFKAQPISEIVIQTIFLKNRIREFRGKTPFDKYKILCSVYYMIMFNMSQGKDILTDAKKLEIKLETVIKNESY